MRCPSRSDEPGRRAGRWRGGSVGEHRCCRPATDPTDVLPRRDDVGPRCADEARADHLLRQAPTGRPRSCRSTYSVERPGDVRSHRAMTRGGRLRLERSMRCSSWSRSYSVPRRRAPADPERVAGMRPAAREGAAGQVDRRRGPATRAGALDEWDSVLTQRRSRPGRTGVPVAAICWIVAPAVATSLLLRGRRRRPEPRSSTVMVGFWSSSRRSSSA